jgi:hypothetical protein
MTQTMMTETEDQIWMLDHTNSLVRQRNDFMPTETATIAVYQGLIETQLTWFAERNVRLVIVDGEYVFEPLTPKPTRKAKAEKPAKELHFIARATFKVTGAVLYGIRSEENVYHITVIAGRITGCVNATTGEDCNGFHYRGTCCHTKYVARLEDERTEQLAVAEVVAPVVLGEEFAQDLEQHVADSIDVSEVVNPWALLSKEERHFRYSAMFPDDYGLAS